jgi:hypothetical protein
MAKEKSVDKKLKRLYIQLNAHSDRPIDRFKRAPGGRPLDKIILTRQGRIEHAIQTIENRGK